MGSPLVLSIEQLRSGFEINGNVLLEPTGYGGEGAVWSAWDKEANRVVAIKVSAVGEDYSSKALALERMTHIVEMLDHPHVLPLYDSGATSQYEYVVMPFILWGALKDTLKDGPLSPYDALIVLAQVADALEYMHGQNIVHRDLKPSNILLDTRHRAYLADFGLAKPLTAATTRAIHTGMGTALYSPPEQHTRNLLVFESDIYSLGIVTFQMLTGKLPWNGEYALAVEQLQGSERIPDPRDVNPTLPAGLVDVLRTMTAVRPGDRPSSAHEAFGLLAEVLGEAGTNGTSSTPHTLEEMLKQGPQPVTERERAAEDARYVLEQLKLTEEIEGDCGVLNRTQFYLIDTVYGLADKGGPTPNSMVAQYMLCGALSYGHKISYWWHSLDNLQLRVETCIQTLDNEDPKIVERALALLSAETPFIYPFDKLPNATRDRLIDLVVESPIGPTRDDALAVLNRIAKSATTWQETTFTPEGDLKLAKRALRSDPFANEVARLIGQAHSESAVRAVLAGLPDEASAGVPVEQQDVLLRIFGAAGSLPPFIDWQVRMRSGALLSRQQLLGDPIRVVGAYLVASLGCTLGVGIYVYLIYQQVPTFLDNVRILNAVGNGVLFGLVFGLGLFVTRLFVHRLKSLPLKARLPLGIGLGGLAFYLGVFGYHVLYLGAESPGVMAFVGSVLAVLGTGLGAAYVSSKPVRMLLAALTIALALGLTWWLSTLLSLTPMLYYEIGQPLRAALLMVVTAGLMGAFSPLVELASDKPASPKLSGV